MRLVLIEWLDAFSTDEWTKIKKLTLEPKRDKSICKTVGWLVHDGTDFLTVVSSLGHNDGAGAMTIPNGCVVRIQDLHVGRAEVAPESEQ
mgnify:CR=1 FL=1